MFTLLRESRAQRGLMFTLLGEGRAQRGFMSTLLGEGRAQRGEGDSLDKGSPHRLDH